MKTKEELYKFYGVKEGIKYEVTAVSEEYSMEVLSQKVGAIFIVEDKRVKFIEDEVYYKMSVLSEYKYCKYREYKPKVKDKLTVEEREYLSAVIKPFRKDVISIAKELDYTGEAFIKIRLRLSYYAACLPCFDKDKMYKGMKLEQEYTLKELEL